MISPNDMILYDERTNNIPYVGLLIHPFRQKIFDFFNASKYRITAQNFLAEKNIDIECVYYYSVATEYTGGPFAHTFHAQKGDSPEYLIKVNRVANVVTEWYRNSNFNGPEWVALDIKTNEVKEYYLSERINGVYTEYKHNAITKERTAINVFQPFDQFTQEQQDKIKNLPMKQSCYGWGDKPAGFTVEFLPSAVPAYADISEDEFNLFFNFLQNEEQP